MAKYESEINMTRSAVFCLMTVLMVFWLVAPAGATATLHGVVLNADQSPVADASVYARGGTAERTSKQGLFALAISSTGTLFVSVDREGESSEYFGPFEYSAEPVTLQIGKGYLYDPLEDYNHRSDPPKKVVGRILGPDEKPVPFLEVELIISIGKDLTAKGFSDDELMSQIRRHSPSTKSVIGPDGRFIFEGMISSHYYFNMASAIAFRAPDGRQIIYEYPAWQITEDSQTGLVVLDDYILTPGAAITGIVADEQGTPVPGALVKLIQGQLTSRASWRQEVVNSRLTDQAGQFTFSVGRGSQSIISASKTGYAAGQTTCTAPAEVRVPLYKSIAALSGSAFTASGDPLAGLEICLIKTSVSVPAPPLPQKFADRPRRPMEVASVETMHHIEITTTAITATDGSFYLSDLAPGEYSLSPSRAPSPSGEQYILSGKTPALFQLSPGLNVQPFQLDYRVVKQ